MSLQRAPQLADVVGWKPHKWSEEEYAFVTGEQIVGEYRQTTFTLKPLEIVSDERTVDGGTLTLRPVLAMGCAYSVDAWKLRVLEPDEYVIIRNDGRLVRPASIAGTVCLEWKKESAV